MRILPVSDEAIEEAAQILQSGGTVVYPTETAYGLAADPFNPTAVGKIFSLKGREDGKPLGLLASSVEHVRMVAEIHTDEEPLLAYWPGALSIVLTARTPSNETSKQAWSKACAGGSSVSIRVTSNAWASRLTAAVGRPVIATSANRSGGSTCYTIQDVLKQFQDDPKPDLVLDAGDLPVTPTSTVVQVKDGKVIVLREGAVQLRSEN